ncbi:hypothetical protein B0H17DRAFT_1045391 [Mycena rosella]|uniref:Uncharacterized protein n=1 Tax=Mycena rosella TaxID=1033263 RepID=A0AAD7GM23_MYCRO|nr:hypothetical protein B0H17DRAFT_1045391 [Mycena rosella]
MEASRSTTRVSSAIRRPQSLTTGLHGTSQINRRHSAILTPRPLRSSPLAGPAFSSEDEGRRTAVEGKGKGHLRIAASAPASRSPSLLLLHSMVDPAESPTSPSRSGRVSFIVPAIRPSTSPSPDSTTASVAEISTRPGKRRSVSQPVVPILKVVDAQNGEGGPEWLAIQRNNWATPPSTRSRSRESLHEPGESWLTSTPAPRFSRLGLAASGVVMPVRKGSVRPKSADARSVGSVPSLISSSSVSSCAQSFTRPSTPEFVLAPSPRGGAKVNEQGILELGKGMEIADNTDKPCRSGNDVSGENGGKNASISRVERAGTIRRWWRKLRSVGGR